MENQKIKNLLEFYLLATELKDKIRSGGVKIDFGHESVEMI